MKFSIMYVHIIYLLLFKILESSNWFCNTSLWKILVVCCFVPGEKFNTNSGPDLKFLKCLTYVISRDWFLKKNNNITILCTHVISHLCVNVMFCWFSCSKLKILWSLMRKPWKRKTTVWIYFTTKFFRISPITSQRPVIS